MEYKRLNTLIHSIGQVKLLAMSMYQISDETEFRKYFLTLPCRWNGLQMKREQQQYWTLTLTESFICPKQPKVLIFLFANIRTSWLSSCPTFCRNDNPLIPTAI